MNRILILCLAIVIGACNPATAQQYLQQSGNVTNGHVPIWITSGILGDAGPATAGNITELGITKNGGLPFCISTAKSPAPYVQMCLGVSTTQGYLSLYSYNGAAVVPFDIIINGTVYPFPGSVAQNFVRVISSGTTDTAVSADVSIFWNSAAASAKTENLYPCNSSTKANRVIVADEKATAGTYPITVVPNGTDTINLASAYAISFNLQSVTLQCDGAGNWVIE